MRIPRLLEVLGRKSGQIDQGQRAQRQTGQGKAAGRAAVPADFAPEARAGSDSPKVYVEDVKVRTDGFQALDAGRPGFRGSRPASGQAAGGPEGAGTGRAAPGSTARRGSAQHGERERITVSAEVEGGGQALRRPPAGRR